MAEKQIAVIGSGLSAIGAIKALIDLGIKPTVLDVGKTLEKDKMNFVKNLSLKTPNKWRVDERELLSKNETIKTKGEIPKKFVFASDFFYGKSTEYAFVKNKGEIPPFSYAKGGLSVGWGASILPPHQDDLKDWPIDINEIYNYCEIILKDLPYSAQDDKLSLSFPILKKQLNPLKLSSRAKYILNKLENNVKAIKDKILYGQARLLVDENKCEYCGECMSGCVYKANYKSDDDIDKFIKEGKINYLNNHYVIKVEEKNEQVSVEYLDEYNNKHVKIFDKIFIACGAVNSARIMLHSLNSDEKLKIKTRGGFVIPVFSFKALDIEWPNVNTQPSLFIEYKNNLKHWVHVQVASDNELLLKMLGLRKNSNNFIFKIKKIIAKHTYLLLVNYHSEHSGHYLIYLKDGVLNTEHIIKKPQSKVLLNSWIELFKILFKIGSIPVYPFAKLNSGSYHVGSSMPMSKNPKGFQTDVLGRIKEYKNVHIVDTSTFPSLPGTTIGLLMMANAYRIVDQSLKDVKNENS